VSEGEKEDN